MATGQEAILSSYPTITWRWLRCTYFKNGALNIELGKLLLLPRRIKNRA